MRGFIEGENRQQSTLFPERVDDYVAEDSSVRLIDVFIDGLDISTLLDGPLLPFLLGVLAEVGPACEINVRLRNSGFSNNSSSLNVAALILSAIDSGADAEAEPVLSQFGP